MFCKNCGTQIDDKAVICPHCGVPQSALGREMAQPAPAQKQETNVLAILGLVLSFFVAIAGLVCSILGMKKAKELNGSGRGLAVGGLVVSIVSMALSVVYLITYIALIVSFAV